MAGTAEKGMQETMRLSREWADIIAKILEYIARRQENRDKTAGMRELARWLKEGHGCINQPIQGKGMAEMVKQELLSQHIPFFETGPDSILIKNTDQEKVKEINRQCLLTRGNYYQVAGADDLENAIARNSKIKDKGITEIKGLSFYEMECLKHKCNDVSKGFTVGVRERDDGKFDLVVRSNKVYEYNPERTDFCEASARYAMSLYGPNSQTKIKQIEDDARTDVLIAGLKEDENEHWLVSADDPTRYVHFYPVKDAEGNIENTRFDYVERYPVKGRDGQPVMKDVHMSTFDSKDPNYEVELIRATDRIKNKVIIDDPDTFNEHLSTLNRTVEPERMEKSYHQAQVAKGEKELTDKMNVMIKNSFGDKRMSPQEAFRRYREDFINIMEHLKAGKVPDGFAEADMKDLQVIVDKREMNLNDYDLAISKYKAMDIEGHDAKAKSKEEIASSRENTNKALRKDDLKKKQQNMTKEKEKDRDDNRERSR